MTEGEVGPVTWSLQESGIETTALHNHVLDESPRVCTCTSAGRSDGVKLAEAIHRALAYSKTRLEDPPSSRRVTLRRRAPAPAAIDEPKIEQILGRPGKENNGVYQFSIARAEKIMDGEMEVPPAMGLATAINFQPTGKVARQSLVTSW